ncbi:F-box domain containing protein [Quillaja saponaria]|uniref:F-box domain containing protein n=1 Tax=Quillaja saponaria TaxID=32244 RepID=A0AAD7M8S8_QUISA|nr:F-box domain containing protein [Quillaja saponaria]KAJ7970676.1 F-box domain containing protein [Quillaja saponaria]
MGSCASLHRKSEADMKLRFSFGSKTDKLVIPPSPIKDKANNGNFLIDDLALKSKWSPSRSTTNFTDYGSKEEAFFDSQAWLDSDCDDDFYSVNGEFTPSRGNTPVHHSFALGTPQGKVVYENSTPGSIAERSPTEKKKNLLELFRDSVRDDQDVDDQNTSGTDSVCSSERIVSGDSSSIREKSIKSVQCCLPSFVSCRSFSGRRRNINPAIAVNEKA